MLMDASTGQWITENPWVKEIYLNANEIKTITLFALVPDIMGLYTITTDVDYSENMTWSPYQSISMDIDVYIS
ncbi:MAG: hypothetical protein ACE5IH_00895 [Thermodesulfobacteriota bacterium]